MQKKRKEQSRPWLWVAEQLFRVWGQHEQHLRMGHLTGLRLISVVGRHTSVFFLCSTNWNQLLVSSQLENRLSIRGGLCHSLIGGAMRVADVYLHMCLLAALCLRRGCTCWFPMQTFRPLNSRCNNSRDQQFKISTLQWMSPVLLSRHQLKMFSTALMAPSLSQSGPDSLWLDSAVTDRSQKTMATLCWRIRPFSFLSISVIITFFCQSGILTLLLSWYGERRFCVLVFFS